MEEVKKVPVKRSYRASLFEMIFRNKKELLELYNAVNGTKYTDPDLEPSLELKAVMLNINPGKNEALKEACKTLKDYAEYTWRVSQYAETMPLEDAVEQAIEECIQEGILAEFLSKNRSEAKSVSIYEYDEARHMRQTREEGREEERLRINSMIQKLVAQNRVEDIIKAASDPKYQEQLLNEFGL